MYADDLILMYGIKSDDSDLCRARTGTVRLAMLLNLVRLGAVWYLPGGGGRGNMSWSLKFELLALNDIFYADVLATATRSRPPSLTLPTNTTLVMCDIRHSK